MLVPVQNKKRFFEANSVACFDSFLFSGSFDFTFISYHLEFSGETHTLKLCYLSPWFVSFKIISEYSQQLRNDRRMKKRYSFWCVKWCLPPGPCHCQLETFNFCVNVAKMSRARPNPRTRPEEQSVILLRVFTQFSFSVIRKQNAVCKTESV